MSEGSAFHSGQKNRLFYRFSDFELDLEEESLLKNGEKMNINRRTFQVLSLLIERKGEIVSKESFFEVVWDGGFVEDNNLTVAITNLRKALGDDAKQARFVENLPRIGYRFVAEVEGPFDRATAKSEPLIPPHAAPPDVPDSGTFDALPPKMRFGRRPVLGLVGIVTILLIGILAFGNSNYLRLWYPANASEQIDSIAVLPFEDGTDGSEYLVDGLTDGIISDLSRIRRLRVIDRNSAYRYKRNTADAAGAGRNLGVQAVVTGQVQRSGDDLLITAEIVRVETGAMLWRQRFQRKVSEMVTTQLDISRAIVQAAVPQMAEADRSLNSNREAVNPKAHDLYLKGRYYWNKRSNIDILRSVDLFKAAIEEDPTYAYAYVGLADAYTLGNFSEVGINSDEQVALSRGAVMRALEIDDSIGEAYSARAINKVYYDRDFRGAEADYRRTIELSPSYSVGHHWYAEFLSMQGRFDESYHEYDLALALDPLSLPIRADLAFAHYYARDYDTALELLNKVTVLDPRFERAYTYLTFVYYEKGMYKEAVEALLKIVEIQFQNGQISAPALEQYRQYYGILGEAANGNDPKVFWRKVVEQKFDPAPFSAAVGYARIGERDRAFEYLEASLKSRYSGMVWLKVSPELDSLRNDSRYPELLRRIGFEEGDGN